MFNMNLSSYLETMMAQIEIMSCLIFSGIFHIVFDEEPAMILNFNWSWSTSLKMFVLSTIDFFALLIQILSLIYDKDNDHH